MELKEIDMKDIVRNPKQPRQSFDHEKIIELSNSIKEGDLLQPITVRPLKNDKYGIVCGERRFRAFEYLKAKKIPAVVREFKDDIDVMEKSAIENWHREDLTDSEKRNVINDLWKSGNYKTKNDLARKTGINHQVVNDYIEAEEYMLRVATPEGASHTLVRGTKDLTDKVRSKVIKTAVKEGISAREIEERIVPKLKVFDDPTTQAEAFERIVERRKQNKKYEEQDFEKDVQRAKGELEPEHFLSEEPDAVSLRILKENGLYFQRLTPSSFNRFKNEKLKREALDYLEELENSIHQLRILLKDVEVV